MQITVQPFRPTDRAAWQVLAQAYRQSYAPQTTEAEYAVTWERLLAREEIFGLGAFRNSQMVGIAQYFCHPSAWGEKRCYLEDLFTAPSARRLGVARRLIEAVANEAVRQGAARYYWHTREQNRNACSLYDKIARHAGFIRYEYQLRESTGA